jgi:cell division septation protein DedD
MTLKPRHWIMAAAAAAALLGSGNALADVRAGIEAWRAGNYEAAVAQWRPLAEAGDADAQFNLGQAFKLGRGVPLDVRQAQNWYERAARQGHHQAETSLGLALFQNGQQQQAMPWLVRAAERGDPRAQYVLGTAHFNGDLIQRDWPLAFALVRAAAAQGFPPAAASVTEMERHLSAEERQRSDVLARQLQSGSSASSATAAAEVPSMAVTQPVQSPRPPRLSGEHAPIVRTPVPASTQTVTAPRPTVRTPAVIRPTPPVRTASPAPSAATGRYRVQLGAFSTRANADRQWQTARRVGVLAGAQHFLVPAGNVTRLQAGPFATRAAADRACASVRAAGQACFVVAP